MGPWASLTVLLLGAGMIVAVLFGGLPKTWLFNVGCVAFFVGAVFLSDHFIGR